MARMLEGQFCSFEGCLGLGDAQLRLQQGGLSASPTLATRLLLLERSGIRLSWSALEGLLGESQAILKLPLWVQQPLPLADLRELLMPIGLRLRPSREQGFEVISSDEEWLESQETALVPLASQELVMAMVTPTHQGLDSWPESWRIVSDSEDVGRILEHLRAAFRMARGQGRKTAPLLWLALKRRIPEVTREVARLTREFLDADAGRHLEALFSSPSSLALNALRQLKGQNLQNWDLPFLVGLLTILWGQPDLREAILELLEELTPSWQEHPEWILGWWEECLAEASRLDSKLVQRLAQITLHWARLGLDLVPLLIRRIQRGLAMEERLLASWLLGQLELDSLQRTQLMEQAWELASEPGLSGPSLLRVEHILANLGQEALAPLLGSERFPRLQADLRCWVVGEALNFADLRPAAQLCALTELAAGSRRMLRHLANLDWKLSQPGVEALDESLRWSLAGFLEQEIPHLEDPDDAWAIAFLVQLDPEILERQYHQAQRDAELNSRAFAVRLETLAKHCAASDRPPEPARLEKLLEASPHHAERPEMWRAWALLFSCPTLESELRPAILEFLTQGCLRFPQLWPEWYEQVQKSHRPDIRAWAEDQLLCILKDSQAPRQTVQAALESLQRRVDHWSQPQSMVRCLSQRLLFLPASLSPQQRMRWALAQDSEGDGVMTPQAWDAEQRDLALALLGRLALRPNLEEGLRRPVRVRCWQFLLDWAEAVGKGGDSYQHRSMPLWTTARLLLTQIHEAEWELVDGLAERVMDLHGSCPERLRLLTHGDCLGYLLDWSLLSPPEKLSSRQRQVLHLLQELLITSDRDYRPVAVGYLVSLKPEQLHPAIQGDWQRLRQRWEGWLYGD